MKLKLNSEQQAAAFSSARNTLVLAGAGTGKTRTLIARVVHLLESGVKPDQIVVITFTRRAANELKARLRAELGPKGDQVIAGTFHHLCLRIMSARRRWFGFEQLTIMDRDDQVHLMRLVRGDVVGKNAAVPQAANLVSLYSFARNTNQSAKKYLEKHAEVDEGLIPTLLEIFEQYRERKQKRSYVDYDDILHRFAKVLHDDADIRQKVCSRYEHLLVDEMQDTNPLQWLILQSFLEHCHLFCVGDDAQSIYAFRGADFKNVHAFCDRVPDSQTLKLEQNYRSTQPILDVANWLLDESKLNYDKKLQATRDGGELPNFIAFGSDLDEAEWIVDAILERHAEGQVWSDNMILCRTAYTARPIEAQLIEKRIPYRFVGGVGLLQMAHVRDLLSLARILVNHRDELGWMRFLTLWPRIGDATASKAIAKLTQASDQAGAADKLEEIFSKRPEIIDTVNQALALSDEPCDLVAKAGELLEPLLENKYDNWESRKRDFTLLKRLAANHRSLSSFLDTYTLDPISSSEADSQTTDEGIVTLITVHSAKGTEAKTCFVAAVQPGNYPHKRSEDDPEAVEEERRVLYVALTRAQDDLILTRNLGRGYGFRSFAADSSQYFLENLPAELVNLGNQVSTNSWYDDEVIG